MHSFRKNLAPIYRGHTYIYYQFPGANKCVEWHNYRLIFPKQALPRRECNKSERLNPVTSAAFLESIRKQTANVARRYRRIASPKAQKNKPTIQEYLAVAQAATARDL